MRLRKERTPEMFKPDAIVKSCPKLESGLRLGIEGIHACQLGPFSSPLFWTADEAAGLKITKARIVTKRKELFRKLNDDHSDITCKQCQMVVAKRFADVCFTRLGRIDYAPTTLCNLRCSFCGNTTADTFAEAKYDALAVLREFSPEDVEWDSIVDFNGGEPTLLKNFDECLEYFASRRIRVILYTNAVMYRQSVYDGLADGSIFWVCSSLDAGTPSTFLQIKKRGHFLKVLENLGRYARAGGRGGSEFAVKYIFCEDNCSDDDIAGFVYAMLAIRPQKIWLTFDFTPFGDLSPDFKGPDYSRQIAAYAKMYNLLKKHGLNATHYTYGHLALICKEGKSLLDKVLSEIEKASVFQAASQAPEGEGGRRQTASSHTAFFDVQPLQKMNPPSGAAPWSVAGKRIVLAPACPRSADLAKDGDISRARIIGFLDRNAVLQGKTIEGIPIVGYAALSELEPDIVLVAAPQQHQADIEKQIVQSAKPGTQIAIYLAG